MKQIKFLKWLAIFSLFLGFKVSAQDYKWGFSVSAEQIMATENWEVQYQFPETGYKMVSYSRKANYKGYAIYYIGAWQYGSESEIVFKPGYLFAENIYSGLHLGLIYRRTFFDRLKVGCGINLEVNRIADYNRGIEPLAGTIDLSLSGRIFNDFHIVFVTSKPLRAYYGYHLVPVINGEYVYGQLHSNVDLKLKVAIEYYP